MGLPHPVSNKLEMHNCWLVSVLFDVIGKCANEDKADVVKDYVGWAIGKGYAVIDVNIPKHVTVEPVRFNSPSPPPLGLFCLLTSPVIWKIQ